MVLRDFKLIFSDNFKAIKELNALFKVLKEKFHYELDNYNDNMVLDEKDVLFFEKMEEEELKEKLYHIASRIQEINKSIIVEIYEQLHYKIIDRNRKFEDLNLESLLNIGEAYLFSKELLTAIALILVKNDEDIKYLQDEVFYDYSMNMSDLIYIIYTSDFLRTNKGDYIKNYLENEIRENYIREDMFMTLSLCISNLNNLESRGEIKAIIKSIPDFENNLKKAKLDEFYIDNIMLFLNSDI